MVPPDIEDVSAPDISGERGAEFASGIFDAGTGVVQMTGGLVAIGASGGLATIPAGLTAADGVNNFVYGVGEVISAVKDDPNYAWNPLEAGYENVAEVLGGVNKLPMSCMMCRNMR